MKEFLESLGVMFAGYYDEEGNFIVDIPSADEYAKVYSKFTNSDKLEEYDSVATDDIIIVKFDSLENDYELSLVMDLEKDLYYVSAKGEN